MEKTNVDVVTNPGVELTRQTSVTNHDQHRIVIGPCVTGKSPDWPVADDEKSGWSKFSKRFFRYLRNCAD